MTTDGCEPSQFRKARNHEESGYAVAEFAVTLPALILVGALVTSIIGLATTQMKLETAAGLGARIVGRGDPIPDSYKNGLPPNTEIEVVPDGDLVEFHLRTNKQIGIKPFIHAISLTAVTTTRLEPAFDEFG